MPHLEIINWSHLHSQCSEGDTAAWEEIAEHFLEWLSQNFCYRRPDVDSHLIIESAEDVLLDYQKRPQRFDPAFGITLGCWLYIQTRGRLSNILRRDRAYRRNVEAIGVGDEEFAKVAHKMSRKRQRNNYYLIEENQQTYCTEEQRQFLVAFSPEERAALILLQERSPQDEWILLLGLEALDEAEQVRRIHRAKERIRKKRQRMVRNSKKRR